MIPTKKDIAFVEYGDEGSATVAKEALHNYKLDGETKMKVCACHTHSWRRYTETLLSDHLRQKITEQSVSRFADALILESGCLPLCRRRPLHDGLRLTLFPSQRIVNSGREAVNIVKV
jgi:hypothetical protein